MVTPESFVQAFPEFAEADSGLLAAKLSEASLRVDPRVWGAKADLGVSYLAAHLLAVSPFGQNARLTAKDGSSIYEVAFDRIKREVAAGPRVI